MSFGIFEILLVLGLVIFFFGAKRIPQLARGVGEGIKSFKQGLNSGDEEGENEKRLPEGDDS